MLESYLAVFYQNWVPIFHLRNTKDFHIWQKKRYPTRFSFLTLLNSFVALLQNYPNLTQPHSKSSNLNQPHKSLPTSPKSPKVITSIHLVLPCTTNTTIECNLRSVGAVFWLLCRKMKKFKTFPAKTTIKINKYWAQKYCSIHQDYLPL